MQQRTALSRAARMALMGAAAACVQASLAAPPELRSEGGLLVLPNVRVEKSGQPVDGRAVSREAGMKAYKDRETGQLRKATNEELLDEALSTPPANNAAGATVTVSAGGRKSAILDESFMSYAVVRKGTDGKLDSVCVTGEAQADRALKGAPVAKEDRHAH
jgi:hypothetical protein